MMFMITALSFYGMATFEGPMMALKSVNALSHYTDWTVGHVHSGALGWVAMITIASFYHMIPRLWDTTIYSVQLIKIHFFFATIGTLLYITAMWVSGIGQGMQLREFDEFGNLANTFISTVEFMHYPLMTRAIGGMFFVIGMLIMVFNVYMTIRGAKKEQQMASSTAKA
jgi:cytochrome c oxidase cbb3-type subunit 1